MNLKISYSYDDIGIMPRELSKIKSRDDIKLTTYVRSKTILNIPIVASPMDTVCNGDMAIELNRLGGVGIIHRFQTIDEQVSELKKFFNAGIPDRIGHDNVGISIGITGDYKERLTKLINKYNNIRINSLIFQLWICFDTANGFNKLIENAINWFKNESGLYNEHQMIVVAGNIASVEGYKFLEKIGCDVIRVGIGSGSACSTSTTTGDVGSAPQAPTSTFTPAQFYGLGQGTVNNNEGNEPQKVYVTEGDITSTQNRISTISNRAKIKL